MENRFKQRLSRMFCSSFGSCRSKHISDVIERPVFVPQNGGQHLHLIEPFFPKPRPFPSMCRPKYPEAPQDSRYLTTKDLYQRSKVSDRQSLLASVDIVEGRKCPPASVISPPLNTFCRYKEFEPKQKEKKLRKTTKKRTHFKNKKHDTWDSELNSSVASNYKGWFSSEDEGEEDDKTTLFSSKSLTSDSSESLGSKAPTRKKPVKSRGRRAIRKDSETGLMPLQGKVKDSFAVVKSSSDPYNDFRTSMVEMIIEKQIFDPKDLENLLQCFLSLNSYRHHRVIIEVFIEIWETFFCNWS